MAAGSRSSADSSASSPLCTASVATCRIRSAVTCDVCIALIKFLIGPSLLRHDGQARKKFHSINRVSELMGNIAGHRSAQVAPGPPNRFALSSRAVLGSTAVPLVAGIGRAAFLQRAARHADACLARDRNRGFELFQKNRPREVEALCVADPGGGLQIEQFLVGF